MKTSKTSAFNTQEIGTTPELLAQDLLQQRRKNFELQNKLQQLSSEVNMLRHLEKHIQRNLEMGLDLDEDHVQILLHSLARIRGIYA
jgi:hypothetical protein